MERICEMGQVMRKAVQVDDQHYCSVRERLAQLEVSICLHPCLIIIFMSFYLHSASSFAKVLLQKDELLGNGLHFTARTIAALYR